MLKHNYTVHICMYCMYMYVQDKKHMQVGLHAYIPSLNMVD